MPDLTHEMRIGGIVAGIDEVGRGPLAGPVLAAAVILPAGFDPSLATKIDDSKKLKPAMREQLAGALAASGAVIGVGAASVAEIATLNILQASLLAMRRALFRLAQRPDHALVDGSSVPPLGLPCTSLVRGDSLSLSIAAASIVAKVTRDRAMARLDRRHPAYGWARNAGYGTKAHRAAIEAHGATPHHRRGFGALLS